MKLIHGFSALLLGTTLLAGGSAFADQSPPPSSPYFSADGHGRHDHQRATSQATGQPQNPAPNARANNARYPNRDWHGSNHYWNSTTLRDRNMTHWSAQARTNWQHGHWSHGRHNGRNGWWWYTNGGWFFYDQPIYPYPGYVSDYYDEDYDNGAYPDQAYGDDEYAPAPGEDGGYYWYYCSNPAGYYPYVQSCRGPWRAVPPTPPGAQQGAGQNQPPAADDNDDQGPPPGYTDNNGPPPQGDEYNGPDDGQSAPPPGYTGGDNNGPPPGYDNGQGNGDDDNGPPPR